MRYLWAVPNYTQNSPRARSGYRRAVSGETFFKCESLPERANLKFREYWSLCVRRPFVFFFVHRKTLSGSMAPKMPRRWAKNLFHFVRDARANEKDRKGGQSVENAADETQTHTPGDMLVCVHANEINQTEAD